MSSHQKSWIHGFVMRFLPWVIFVGVFVVVLLIWVLLMVPLTGGKPDDKFVLRPVTFADLQGWSEDTTSKVVPAFQRSCRRILSQADDKPIGGVENYAGRSGDWREACAALFSVDVTNDTAVRTYFETHFTPIEVSNGSTITGKFTGYYEPVLSGSRLQTEAFQVPIHGVPNDLIQADLGLFREEFLGKKLAGRVVDGFLKPYETRADIESGALGTRAPVLAYVDDSVDAFFLQVQGSGRIELAEGGVLRVGYAGQNGRPYTSIGRVLVEQGELTLEEASMQSIRAWFVQNPDRMSEIMGRNESYIFFEELTISDPDLGPLGSEGLPLEPERSMAVDRSLHAYGVPVWIDTTAPTPNPEEDDQVLRRLMVAQDSGGAIRGPVRGDIFWGMGKIPAEIAGRMNEEGAMYLLLPKAIATDLVVDRAKK